MKHDQQWKLVCEPAFKRLEEGQEALKGQLEAYHAEMVASVARSAEILAESVGKLERTVYKDNGSRSIQTRLNDHERCIKVVTWLGGMIVSAAVLAFLGYVFWDVFSLKRAQTATSKPPITSTP